MNKKQFSFRIELIKLIRILYGATKLMFPVMILQNMILGAMPFVNIWFGYRILDMMLGGLEKSSIMGQVYQMAVWNLVLGVLAKCLERCRIVLRERVYLKVDENIIDKTLVMDYELMESRYRADLLRTVQEGQNAGNDICTFCDRLCGVIQDLFSLVYAVILLAGLFTAKASFEDTGAVGTGSAALLLLVVLFLLVIALEGRIVARQNGLYDDFYQGNLSTNRKLQYFNELIYYNYKNGKDFRLYRMSRLIMDYLKRFYEKRRLRFWQFLVDSAKLEVICFAAEGFLLFLAWTVVGLRAAGGMISAAEALKYVSTLTLFSGACKSVMNRYGELNRILFSLRNYAEYLELEGVCSADETVLSKGPEEEKGSPRKSRPAENGGYELEFRDVSFHYPDSSEMILDHVSFKIRLQDKTAIVGRNGAGKSTFIKLLCRLYHPTDGVILLDGVDIQTYAFEEYRKLFAVVFQDFKLYAFGLGANVAAEKDYDAQRVWEALKGAGVKERAQEFPNGLDTLLYSWFEGGVEISGGEEQKIAIARALYKDAPIVILDEPTSALDPISEYEIYRKCNTLVQGKAAVYISHRMSSCRFCDQILVFEHGKITQMGSHEKLLHEKGLYQELWNAQAQYYVMASD